MSRRYRRRQVVAAFANAAVWCNAPSARASPRPVFSAEATLFVAGPLGGWLDLQSRILAAELRQHLPAAITLTRNEIGGVDGVTGANQFAIQSTLDGSTALLIPGATPLAWLVGDNRVHFDPARWLPILLCTEPATVVGRAEHAIVAGGAPIRVAAGRPADPSLAAMLAYDLLGMIVEPVFGFPDEKSALAALRSGRLDAVLVRGPFAGGSSPLRPLFCLGFSDHVARHGGSLVTAVPSFNDYAASQGKRISPGPRFDAWRCAAASAQLRYALVLPSLTPASAVALWRQAATMTAASTLGMSNSIIDPSAAADLISALNVSGAALLDLRGWMANRLGWQPG